MPKTRIRKNDIVQVIAGRGVGKKSGTPEDRGKRGKVIQVSPEEGKVIVSGANVISKHVKPRKQGEAGGIIKAEGAMYSSKVQLYCGKCGKGVRIKVKNEGDNKLRICASCGNTL